MSSSSSSLSAQTPSAFIKECAPFVLPIGDYQFVDLCDFPSPPELITAPDIPPIPIPPIETGCWQFNIHGTAIGPTGEVVPEAIQTILTYPYGDPCIPDIDIQFTIPCLIGLEAGGTAGAATGIPEDRYPSFWLEVEQVPGEPCQFLLDFNYEIPCPIKWGDVRTEVIHKLETGLPSLELDVGSSSADCQPQLNLVMHFPCPIEIDTRVRGPNFIGDPELDEVLPWFREPTVSLQLSFADDDSCRPTLELDLNIPCPIEFDYGSTASIEAKDSDFLVDDVMERRWAFGQPTMTLNIEYKEVGGNETPCFPRFTLEGNFPCPTGGLHRDPASTGDIDATIDASLLQWRQDQYANLYGTEIATQLPYYNRIPAGSVVINRDIPFFQQNSDAAGSAFGRVGMLEFDESCQLRFDMSMYIPCGIRSPRVTFHHASTYGMEDPPALSGYSASIIQDWDDSAYPGDCAFNEELQLFLTPGGSGELPFPANCIPVIVNVSRDGGEAGNATTQCSFTYGIWMCGTYPSGSKLAESRTPVVARTEFGEYQPAGDGTRGLAQSQLNGSWALLQAFGEVPEVTTCY